ncbi:MAG: hypothetical protein KGL44_03020 [Sphingomonadales bacterium]|nr:hypothetical protein [Sphingomonadales bacterium]
MATATIRKVDDRDYATIGEMAEAHGRSISEELRCLIAEAARKRRVETLLVEMHEFRKRNPLKLPEGTTSLDLLREERDSW